MSHIVDIFLQPGRVFADQKERPTFLVPLLIVSAFAAAFTLAYFLSVDPIWYLDQDNDGCGDPSSSIQTCFQPAGYVGNNSDACPLDAAKVLGSAYVVRGGGPRRCEERLNEMRCRASVCVGPFG